MFSRQIYHFVSISVIFTCTTKETYLPAENIIWLRLSGLGVHLFMCPTEWRHHSLWKNSRQLQNHQCIQTGEMCWVIESTLWTWVHSTAASAHTGQPVHSHLMWESRRLQWDLPSGYTNKEGHFSIQSPGSLAREDVCRETRHSLCRTSSEGPPSGETRH